MSEEAAEQARQRAEAHRQLVDALEALLYRHDPLGIAVGDDPDEYEPEARSIAARLVEATTVAGVRTIVHEEFGRWFGYDVAGPETRYQAVAEEIWARRG